MFNIRFTYNFLFLVIIVFSIQVFSAEAQLKPITKSDSILYSKNGNWYEPSKYQFESQYPKLTYLPPITSDMPYDVMVSYFVLDSILRNWNVNTQTITNRWRKQKIKNDTIVSLIKYIYKIMDFDPIRFALYHNATGRSYSPYSSLTSVYTIKGIASELLGNVQTLYNPSVTALLELNQADYILRVHINSIDSLNLLDQNEPNRIIYNVNATVIDTLKGKQFQQCNINFNSSPNSKNNNVQTNNSQICFTYITGDYGVYGNGSDFYSATELLNSKQNLTLHSGQDLVVALSHGKQFTDFNFKYFQMDFITALPIINGQVKDEHHIWSNSILLNYSDWKNAFNQRLNMLFSGSY